MLGAVLRRVHRSGGKERRGRLEKLFDQWAKAWPGGKLATRKPGEMGLQIRELDTVLHGREGVERSAYRSEDGISRAEASDVTDDPSFVAELVRKSPKPQKFEVSLPRLVFLGGEPVMEFERKQWKAYAADKHAQIVEAFAPIKLPAVAELMLEM